MTHDMPPDSAFYRRWILANAWAECAGLGTTFVGGWLISPFLEEVPGAATIVAGALAAVTLGMLLEGVVVGWAQGAVLHRWLPALSLRSWVLATALGAGMAWTLGMIPSTVLALATTGGAASSPEPSVLVQYPLAVALGLITGPVLGFAQWRILRRHVPRAGRWLWANALAWAVGMPLIFLGMDRVPWSETAAAVVTAIYATCAVTGVAVGAIHGWFLLKLLEAGQARTESA